MKLMIPKEHGAWAMWITPYLIGIFLTEFTWVHISLFVSIFFAYISISPFLQGIKRKNDRKVMWKHSFSYLTIASIIGIPILIFYPNLLFILVLILPFFLINIYYVKKKRERAFLNDLVAVIELSSTILVSYYVGAKQYDFQIILVWLLLTLFFLGSIFYVKSAIRERHNYKFKKIAKVYTLLLPIFGLVFFNIYLMIAYLFSTIRLFLLKDDKNPSSMKIGIIEIFNSIWFATFIIISFRL